jgi:hypothetical protein
LVKKSQAALEFLTTYAWAFLVIIIMVAALAYFGILRPQQVLPDRCTFNVGFGCEAFQIDVTNSEFRLNLKNNVGKVIDVSAIRVTSDDGTALSCTNSPTNPTSWGIAAVQTLVWDTACNYATLGITAGEKGKLLVEVDYFDVKAGSGFLTTAEGDIFGAVQ